MSKGMVTVEREVTRRLDGWGNVISVKLMIERVVDQTSETLVVTKGWWASIDEEGEGWVAVVVVNILPAGLFCQSTLLISSLKIGYLWKPVIPKTVIVYILFIALQRSNKAA